MQRDRRQRGVGVHTGETIAIDLAPPTATSVLVGYTLPGEAVLAQLRSSPEGLAAAEADRRLAECGPNRMPQQPEDGLMLVLWRQIRSPISWLLMAAGGLAVALGKPTDAAAVWGALALNVLPTCIWW